MKRWWLQALSALALAAVSMNVAPAALAQGCASPYTVVAGDSLWRISRKCGTTVAAIQAANPGINQTFKRNIMVHVRRLISKRPLNARRPTTKHGIGEV